jgi:hypothetical protein
MDLQDVQSALNARGWSPPLAVDGQWGPETAAAVDALLREQGVDPSGWGAARSTLAGAQLVCRLAGIDAGKVDGLMGPQTRHALDVWDARQKGDSTPETWRDRAEVEAPPPPIPRKTVWPVQSDVRKFYGEINANQTQLTPPYPMRIAWDLDTPVKQFSIHEKVHDSAARVLDRVLDHYGLAGIATLGLDRWGGCLNPRRMRGGSAWSMHSWGIAIDFDPDRNDLHWGRNRARLARPDAEMWWRLWEEEGWLSLGRARNYDWMHIQAARL